MGETWLLLVLESDLHCCFSWNLDNGLMLFYFQSSLFDWSSFVQSEAMHHIELAKHVGKDLVSARACSALRFRECWMLMCDEHNTLNPILRLWRSISVNWSLFCHRNVCIDERRLVINIYSYKNNHRRCYFKNLTTLRLGNFPSSVLIYTIIINENDKYILILSLPSIIYYLSLLILIMRS